MWLMVLGLVFFLGIHSSRIFAESWRERMIRRLGANSWKGIYSVVSIFGFGLIIFGYGLTRQSVDLIWSPPVFTRHLAALLVLFAFVLVVAAYVPGNWFKVKLGHPMILGVKVWAIAHLLASGKLANIVLFGAFLVWAVLCFSASRKRDRQSLQSQTDVKTLATIATVLVGVLLWAFFAFWGHGMLIGVRPFS